MIKYYFQEIILKIIFYYIFGLSFQAPKNWQK